MSSAQLLTLTGEASRRSASADQLPRAVVKIAMRRCLPLLVLLAVHLGASEELGSGSYTGSYALGTPGTATCPDGFALVVSEDACRALGLITSSGAARYTGTGEAAGGKLSFAGDSESALRESRL